MKFNKSTIRMTEENKPSKPEVDTTKPNKPGIDIRPSKDKPEVDPAKPRREITQPEKPTELPEVGREINLPNQ